jgi:hypothetical protein
VFLGAIIYMGVHTEPQIEMYWNSDFNKGPLHSITSHISRNRFEQIKRYCHISCPISDEQNRNHLPSNKVWWYKLEPLASIQASSQRYYSPSSEVSIDELMVRCFGRCVSLIFTPLPLYFTTLLITLDPYTHTRCPRSRLNKGTRSMDLRITDIYIIGLGALGRKDYKGWFSTLLSRIPVLSYEA